MKRIIIISLLSIGTLNGFAQSADQSAPVNNTVCRKAPNMPASAVQVWPKDAYIPLEDKSCPPCYEYRGIHGTTVMECPFILPAQPGNSTAEASMSVQAQNTYTGNYPVCKPDPNMPRNGKPVWPKSAYIPSGNPACAPCYEYTTKHGLKVMECPNALLTQ